MRRLWVSVGVFGGLRRRVQWGRSTALAPYQRGFSNEDDGKGEKIVVDAYVVEGFIGE